jgi:hypothetical protein
MMEQAKTYSAFFSSWKDLTEKNGIPAAFDHSWIKNLERGLVWIEVDHPGWKQIIQTKESKLLYDFQYRFPEMDISGISIVLCRPGSRPEYTPEKPVEESATASAVSEPSQVFSPAASDTAAVEAHTGYEAIKDEPLKEALMRLEKSIIKKNKQSRK